MRKRRQVSKTVSYNQYFASAFFFVKGKNEIFKSFYYVSDDSEQLGTKFEKEFMKNFTAKIA